MDAIRVKSIYWETKKKIKGTPWTIRGYSRSSYRTGFYLPELNIMLDVGPQNFNKPDTIFITHPHLDHIAELPMTLIEDMHTDHKVVIYCHPSAVDLIDRFIKSAFMANAVDATEPDVSNCYEIIGVAAGSELPLIINKNKVNVEVFNCDHTIPTISYGFSLTVDKLKDEYKGLPGKEIGQLRKSGVAITEAITKKKFAYVCDTTIAVFKLNPSLIQYPVIYIECTFLFPEEKENAIKTNHIHWDDIKPIIIANPDIHFVLFHFSQRYKDSEIDKFFDTEFFKNPYFDNFDWWTSDGEPPINMSKVKELTGGVTITSI